MTPEHLRSLISLGESLKVEFKGEEKAPLSDRDLIEAVVCLANRTGDEPGWLLIGVEDDGRITGARPRHEDGVTDPARLASLVAGRTRPSLLVRVFLVPLNESQVLALEIPPSRLPVGTADGHYLRRVIGSDGRPVCLPMHFHEMQTLQADRGLLDYSALTLSEARWEDLDSLEL
ncbi:MAG: ATP-binding protein, partial [Meiothermus sp.]|nr:ATP-binding protein [Meiothermus sp.]